MSQKPEPCPTPLAWQEVVKSFHEQAMSRIVETPAAEVTVHELGSGKPLVFLPAFSGNALLFSLTCWLLRDDCRSVVIEHPAWKKTPSHRDLIPRTAEAISMALEHSCPDGADIYAATWGGQVALQLMLDHPQLVHRAILQSSWAHRKLTTSESILLGCGSWLPVKARRLPMWLPTQLQNHRNWFPPFDETRFGFLLGETGVTPASALARRLLASSRTDLTPQLHKVSTPITLLRCEGDGTPITVAQDILEDRLPNVKSESMSSTGHFPYLTHPHRLVKVLRATFDIPRTEIVASTASH